MGSTGDGRRVDRRWVLFALLLPTLLALVAAAVFDVARTSASRASKADQPNVASGRAGSPGDRSDASRSDASRSDADRSPVPHLLPNLRIRPAGNVVVDTKGTGRRLRFDATLVNAGAGPLEVAPDALTTCPPGQRHVAQVIYQEGDGDGRFDREVDRVRSAAPAGCMLFHPGHDHWHVDATAAYALTPADGTTPIVSQDKVSFCLRDSNLVPKGGGPAKHYAKCARNRVQGISSGWSDLYDASLAGQALELPAGLRDGDYCLRLQADPADLFRESDEEDNGSSLLVRITDDRVTVPAARRCST